MTAVHKETKVATGIVLVGFLISSLTVAIRSYPSKAMKVSPIATMTPPIPLGNRGVKLSCASSGLRLMAASPKAIKRPSTAILARVITFSALPVTSAPTTLSVIKKALMANVMTIIAPSCPTSPITGWYMAGK